MMGQPCKEEEREREKERERRERVPQRDSGFMKMMVRKTECCLLYRY